jgi:hypothetical protein
MPKGNMGVMTAIKMRRSIRHYKDKPIEEEKLDRVLEANEKWSQEANTNKSRTSNPR